MPRRRGGASSRRRLTPALPETLPSSLEELAGYSDKPGDIGFTLRRRLGMESLWLFAEPLFGYPLAGDDIPDLLEDTAGIPVPVQYHGLRRLFAYEDVEIVAREYLAVFTVLEKEVRAIEQYYEHAVYDYPEVAIELGQAATLLELYEFNPRIVEWQRRGIRPYILRDERHYEDP